MIVNALRIADPTHRTLVMAPEILLEQWASEFSTRCNLSPVTPKEGETDADHENAPVWLIQPERVLQPGFLDWATGQFDLLIVDEPQTLTQAQHDAQAAKGRNALLPRRFASLLLLSATPGFGNPRMRRQILRLIEPDRADAAMIAEDESNARHALLAGEGDPETHWAAQSLERRLCRWTRAEWPEIAPERGAQRAQRLHRRGDPARDAMRALNRPYPPEEGNTRFDALLDRLLALWAEDPEARVVVVVGDNPTIDRLTPRLQAYFTEAGPVAQVRYDRDTQSEEEAIAASHDRLEDYRTGTSRLVLIGNAQRLGKGLNLHYGTREIIFYACAAGDGHHAAFERLSSLAAENLFDLSDPVLAAANPHTRARAVKLYEGLETAEPPGALPCPDPETNGARAASKNALDGWMRAMRAAGVFRIARREDDTRPDVKGRLLWYPDTAAKGPATRPIPLPVLETASTRRHPNYDDGAVAFVARRRHLATPPAVRIALENLSERSLRFLDHGNAFLGQLCETLGTGVDDASLQDVAVIYPPGHPFAAEGEPMVLACALEEVEARGLSEKEREAVIGACSNDRDVRAVLRRLHAGLAADARWMRWQRPARFALAGLRLDPAAKAWMPMPESACVAALDPDALSARKALIGANCAHEVRALMLGKTRDVEKANLDSEKNRLVQRYDARIAATRRIATLRCLMLEKGCKTVRRVRHLAIYPRPRRED